MTDRPPIDRSSPGPGHGGHAEPDLPSEELRVVLVRDPGQLEERAAALERLEAVAAEPNPFFSSRVLLPSMRELGSPANAVALVTGEARQSGTPGEVVAGLFPLSLRGRRAQLWLHRYAFLGTPLVRADSLRPTLRAFTDWCFGERGVRLLQVPRASVDGPVFRALVDEVVGSGRPYWVQDQHLRASFDADVDAETYRKRSQARKVRRNLRRALGQLAERGQVTTEIGPLAPGEVERFAGEFLRVEASGWKGRGGTALGSDDRDARWFRAVLGRLAKDGRAIGAALRLDGDAVAMGVLFTDPGGGEAVYFKTGFDEAFAELSVGALLQQELIGALHRDGMPASVDSCAAPGHPMIDRMWRGRRMMQTLWIGSGTAMSRLALSALPGARWVRSRRRGRAAGPRR